MKRLLVIILFLMGQNAFAQKFNFPRISPIAKTVEAFVPAGWHIKDKTTGDLNGDGMADIVMVIEYHASVKENRDKGITNEGHPRVLLIFFKTAAGYNLALQNNTFILRDGEGGMSDDPYDKLAITKGVLNINFEFVRESLNYKVRYQNNDFYLIGASDYGHSNSGDESTEFNFLTRKYVYSSSPPNDSHEKGKTEEKHIPVPALKKLSELKQPYAWEVFKDVFI